MQEYVINVAEIEELQTLQNRDELDKIFGRAERAIIGGGTVVLTRRYADGREDKFDEFSTEADLSDYKKNVYKYLS